MAAPGFIFMVSSESLHCMRKLLLHKATMEWTVAKQSQVILNSDEQKILTQARQRTPGVDILPLIHKCFPYQPFKNQVILPQFSSKLPLNNQPHTIVLSLCLNVFMVFTLQNILLSPLQYKSRRYPY